MVKAIESVFQNFIITQPLSAVPLLNSRFKISNINIVIRNSALITAFFKSRGRVFHLLIAISGFKWRIYDPECRIFETRVTTGVLLVTTMKTMMRYFKPMIGIIETKMRIIEIGIRIIKTVMGIFVLGMITSVFPALAIGSFMPVLMPPITVLLLKIGYFKPGMKYFNFIFHFPGFMMGTGVSPAPTSDSLMLTIVSGKAIIKPKFPVFVSLMPAGVSMMAIIASLTITGVSIMATIVAYTVIMVSPACVVVSPVLTMKA